MEPTNMECNLRCPADGEEVRVAIDCFPDGACCISRCTQFGDGPVTCEQQCLDGVTHGTHWKASTCSPKGLTPR